MTIEIANRLVALRKSQGLSQEELAEQLGVSRQAVSKWERAEASPDLDKLIMLSKLYDVSLDDLLLERQEEKAVSGEIENSPSASLGKEMDESQPQRRDDETDEEKDAASDEAGNPDERSVDSDASESCGEEAAAPSNAQAEPEKAKSSVHISFRNGIHVKDEGGDVVHVSWKGIHVEEHDGDQVHVGPAGIHVEEQTGHRVDVSSKGAFVDGQPVAQNRWFYFPYPILALGLFLGWGFSGLLGGWRLSWLAFLTIPFYYTVVAGIRKRQWLQNSFALFALLLFFLWGFSGWLGGWRYSWMIFLSIPLFYSALVAVRERRAVKFCYPVLALLLFLVWGFWGGLGGFALSWLCFLTIPLYYWFCRTND